jgi:hypothetical protein
VIAAKGIRFENRRPLNFTKERRYDEEFSYGRPLCIKGKTPTVSAGGLSGGIGIV